MAGKENSEISIKDVALRFRDFCRYLVRNWKSVLMGVVFGGILGIVYSIYKKPLYTAVTTFVLEEGGGGGFSQYAGIASMVGIDFAGGETSGLFQGENIFELYKSRLMIEKTLLSESMFNGKKGLLIDRYAFHKGLKDYWAKDPKLSDISFSIPKSRFTIGHDSIITTIVNDINRNFLVVEKENRKLSIISVKVTSEDQLFAKAFADNIVANVNEFYIATKTKKAMQNVSILQKQADSIRYVLNSSIGSAAATLDANPNANAALQMLRVPSQRKQIDIQSNSAMYAEIVKNLEIARISLRNEMPLIQIVDRPILPLAKREVSKRTGLVIGSFIGFFLVVIVLLLSRLYKGMLLGE